MLKSGALHLVSTNLVAGRMEILSTTHPISKTMKSQLQTKICRKHKIIGQSAEKHIKFFQVKNHQVKKPRSNWLEFMLWLLGLALELISLAHGATAGVGDVGPGSGCDSDGVEGLRHAVLGALLGDSYAWTRGQGNMFRNQQFSYLQKRNCSNISNIIKLCCLQLQLVSM